MYDATSGGRSDLPELRFPDEPERPAAAPGVIGAQAGAPGAVPDDASPEDQLLAVAEQGLAGVRLTAETHNGWLHGTLTGRHGFQLSIAPGIYHRAAVADLESLGARLAARLFAERVRAEYADVEGDHQLSESERAAYRTPADDTFDHALSQLAVSGVSPDRVVQVDTVGLRHFTITLAANVRDTHGETEFVRAVEQAVEALLREITLAVVSLKRQTYR